MKNQDLDSMPAFRSKGRGLTQWLKWQQWALHKKELELIEAVREFEKLHHWQKGCSEFAAGLLITLTLAGLVLLNYRLC